MKQVLSQLFAYDTSPVEEFPIGCVVELHPDVEHVVWPVGTVIGHVFRSDGVWVNVEHDVTGHVLVPATFLTRI